MKPPNMTITMTDFTKLQLFDQLKDAYAKFYSPSEHLAMDEVTGLFKGRVNFKQYIPTKHKNLGIKIYKLCNITGYTCDNKNLPGKGQAKFNADNNSYMCNSGKFD
jgi:hypothetical protein